MALDPFQSAISQNDQSKQGLLEAVANAGTAGKQAFERAQTETAANQKNALAGALQSAQTAGYAPESGLATGEQNKIGETYGRFGTNLAAARANFEGGLANTQASNASYLSKLGASLP